jgi:uncharacterized protein
MEENAKAANDLTPTQSADRLAIIDIIRGFALLGILTVNMSLFYSPAIYMDILGLEQGQSLIDRLAVYGMDIFIQGKFYPMFSFLFGFGFIIFIERAEQKGYKAGFLYFRRLLVLLIIGVAHAFLLWFGDILITYALLAMFLLLFRKRQPKTILIWAVSLVLITLLMAGFFIGISLHVQNVNPEAMKAGYMEYLRYAEVQLEQSYQAYGEGSFADIYAQRKEDLSFLYSQSFILFPFILAMFLFGLFAAKIRIFQQVQEHSRFIRKVWIGSLLVSIPMVLLELYSSANVSEMESTMFDFYYLLGHLLSGASMCFFYISSLTLITNKNGLVQQLAPIGKVGRMALSNYLLQTILCTTFFYSYGFGLYGKVSPASGVIITLVIYGMQIVLSHYWLTRYSFGPAEWIWRNFTYGKIQPIQLSRDVTRP